jgi:hypothetical protein
VGAPAGQPAGLTDGLCVDGRRHQPRPALPGCGGGRAVCIVTSWKLQRRSPGRATSPSRTCRLGHQDLPRVCQPASNLALSPPRHPGRAHCPQPSPVAGVIGPAAAQARRQSCPGEQGCRAALSCWPPRRATRGHVARTAIIRIYGSNYNQCCWLYTTGMHGPRFNHAHGQPTEAAHATPPCCMPRGAAPAGGVKGRKRGPGRGARQVLKMRAGNGGSMDVGQHGQNPLVGGDKCRRL